MIAEARDFGCSLLSLGSLACATIQQDRTCLIYQSTSPLYRRIATLI